MAASESLDVLSKETLSSLLYCTGAAAGAAAGAA